MLIILKGIAINLGVINQIIIISISSFVVFSFMNKNISLTGNMVNNNIKDEIVIYANALLTLIFMAIVFNIILSIVLSIYDTSLYMKNDIDIYNFEKQTMKNEIIENGKNEISRKIIHMFMLLDGAKLALTNMIIDDVFKIKKKEDYYFLILTVIFFMNFIKLFGFSLSFVFLQKSVKDITDKFIILIQK